MSTTLKLRKARQLETKIGGLLNQQNISLTVQVLANATESTVQEAVKKAQENISKQVEQNRKLTQVRYAIRQRIDEANQKVGISALMNKREQLQHELKVVNALETNARFSQDAVTLTLASKKASLEKGERHVDVNTNITAVDDALAANVKAQVKSLRAELEEVEDQLVQKNAGAEVTLTSEEVELLKVVDLL